MTLKLVKRNNTKPCLRIGHAGHIHSRSMEKAEPTKCLACQITISLNKVLTNSTEMTLQ